MTKAFNPPSPISFVLPYWYDLHAHFRQGRNMRVYLAMHAAMFCEGILAMPNTVPPLSKVIGRKTKKAWSLRAYRNVLRRNAGKKFSTILVPLYLTKGTTPEMIADAIEHGFRNFKYYPPHGTTNSEDATDFQHYLDNGVIAAIEKHDGILNIHGEASGIANWEWFDRNINAEVLFYTRVMPLLVKRHPKLRIVCEHITTAEAVNFVLSYPRVGATVCPQHLLYTVGDLLKAFSQHLLCMPLVKYLADLKALRRAVTDPNNRRFFAGTDSAPHPDHDKHTPCGCAAGCFTGGYAPQLYVTAFEEAGLDMSLDANQEIFINFLVKNGANFYGLPIPPRLFRLTKKPQRVRAVKLERGKLIPLPLGMNYKRVKERKFMPTTTKWTAEAA